VSDIPWWVIALGLTGQALFTSRALVQWIASERARRPVAPRVYWWLSLGGSAFVLVYTFLAKNPIFALSILPGAVIYIRNLLMVRPASLQALLPGLLGLSAIAAWMVILQPRTGTPLMTAIGLCGSVCWSARFIVQWWMSERRGTPMLPPVFWWLSLIGSILLLVYAIGRRDPVMVLAYALNGIPYVRNLILGRRAGVRAPSRP
jgi:lipid-A-disaccharide synthase-like uncharacterized protein